MPLLAHQSEQTAYVGGGVRAAIDEKPSSSRLGGRHSSTRRYVNVVARWCQGRVRNCNDTGHRRREAAIGPRTIKGSDDFQSPRKRHLEQFAQQAVVGAAEAEVDDVGALLNREVEGLGEAERVANGLTTWRSSNLPAPP